LPHLRALCAFAVIEADTASLFTRESPPSASFYLAALREVRRCTTENKSPQGAKEREEICS